MRYEVSNILGGLCLYAGLLQKAEIPEPVDKPNLPLAEGRIIPVRQTSTHSAAVRQWIARMPPHAVDVKLDIRHADLQHRVEIFHGPDRVDAVA